VAEALKLYGGEWKRSSKTGEAKRNVQANIYRDNLYVVANSWEDFAWAVRLVSDLVIAANLRFGSGNVSYSVDVLGYKIGVGEWKPLEKALETIAAFPTPRTKKQVRSFLGKTGYYRSLVPE
jgi:hypothetical protein